MEEEDRRINNEQGKMPGEKEIQSNPVKTRLVIEKLVLENFKSYAGVRVIAFILEFHI